MADQQWSFLAPWHAVLRRVLEYVDCDELIVGTMQDRLDHVRLCLHELVELDDYDGFDSQVIELREGLELLGLALHYDPRVWSEVLHPLIDQKNPFAYDAAQLQPCFHVVYPDEAAGGVGGIHHIVQLLTGTEHGPLHEAYRTAKRTIQKHAGSEWDSEYRIPISIRVEPGQSDWSDWANSLRHLVWTLQDPLYPFQLVSLDVNLASSTITTLVVDLLAEIRLANVVVKTLGLPLEVGGVELGAAINMATGATHQHQSRPQLVEALALDQETTTEYGQLCSSVAQGRMLDSLTTSIWSEGLDRMMSWRWLGFAVRGRFASPSLRHLRLDQCTLSASDVQAFAEPIDVPEPADRPTFPNFTKTQVVRYVRVQPGAMLGLADGSWHQLEDTSLSSLDRFVVVDDSLRDNAALVSVILPGFGCAVIKASDIIHADLASVQSPTMTRLVSLDLRIMSTSQPLAVAPFASLFGASLQRLQISVAIEYSLNREEAIALLVGCPLLELLILDLVSIGTMDVVLDAYALHGCRLRVLSLYNSCVDSASFVRFATALQQDPAKTAVAQHLVEFRYVFEKTYHPTSRKCKQIIKAPGVMALRDALLVNHRLQFLDIALAKEVYDKYARLLRSHEKPAVQQRWLATKLAVLSVVVGAAGSDRAGDSPTLAKRARSSLPTVPVKHRRRLVSHILQFIRPPLSREVSVVRVPRRL